MINSERGQVNARVPGLPEHHITGCSLGHSLVPILFSSLLYKEEKYMLSICFCFISRGFLGNVCLVFCDLVLISD